MSYDDWEDQYVARAGCECPSCKWVRKHSEPEGMRTRQRGTNMKIWVITESDYDGMEIIAIFSSEERAKAFVHITEVKAKRNHRSLPNWDIEDWEVDPGCPADTNGDGDCGKPMCSYCGTRS